ncbi:MAG: hypothetical protein KAX80_13215 [Planctomycetes bacterium]|nr:hypothetical protein [Planctomycetota bacterium]
MDTMVMGDSGALALLVLLVLVAMLGVTLLGIGGSDLEVPKMPAVQQVSVPAIEWTGLGENVEVLPGMTIKEHANRHRGQVLDAWKIYTYLYEGQCIASAVFCGPSDIEKLYLCMDPWGRIGGLYRFGDEITSGYEGSLEYWTNKVNGDSWGVCDD